LRKGEAYSQTLPQGEQLLAQLQASEHDKLTVATSTEWIRDKFLADAEKIHCRFSYSEKPRIFVECLVEVEAWRSASAILAAEEGAQQALFPASLRRSHRSEEKHKLTSVIAFIPRHS
jgi:hypothetical protein